MIMSSSLLFFSLNPPLTHKTSVFFSNKPSHSSLSSKSNTLVCRFSYSAAAAEPPDSEEIRWLREEQRWLREEQRWLREEQRWIRERESLLREIAELKLKIQSLDKNQSSFISAEETVVSVAGLLQVLTEKNLISAQSQSGKNAMARVLDEGRSEDQENVKTTTAMTMTTTPKTSKTKTLRKGSEGEEVKAMQVC